MNRNLIKISKNPGATGNYEAYSKEQERNLICNYKKVV
jgi:hypothetical protein